MLSREDIAKAVETYCRAESEKDWSSWINLFAEEVVHEEPVGVTIRRGRDELRSLWSTIEGVEFRLRVEDLIVCGAEAVAILAVDVGSGEPRHTSRPIVDHFTFDETGKIVGVRVFLEIAGNS
jgi:steroid delta-isomerase